MKTSPYRLAHDKVRARRGRASQHQCAKCIDSPAAEWALRPPDECLGNLHVVNHEGEPRWFSDCPEADYIALCSPHHREMDASLRAEFEETFEFEVDPYADLAMSQ